MSFNMRSSYKCAECGQILYSSMYGNLCKSCNDKSKKIEIRNSVIDECVDAIWKEYTPYNETANDIVRILRGLKH